MSCNDWKWEKDIDIEDENILRIEDIAKEPLSSPIIAKKTHLPIESQNLQEIPLKHLDPPIVLE